MAILTISRQYGSGIREIRLEIARNLNYSYVDKRSLMTEIGEKGPRWEKWAREFDESAPTTWEKHDWSFKVFGALLHSVMLNHCIQDNVILAGRGAGFLLEGIAHAFRVRFVAPMEQRVERISVWESVNKKIAESIAKKKDSERAGFVEALYGRDINNPQNYDAVFNTGMMPEDAIVNVLMETLIERDRLKTEEAQNLLRLRAAAARVRAGLMIDTKLYVPTLEVITEGDELIVKGIVRNAGQYSKITEAARYFAEDFPIKVQLHFR